MRYVSFRGGGGGGRKPLFLLHVFSDFLHLSGPLSSNITLIFVVCRG